jgi:HSP20 family protein
MRLHRWQPLSTFGQLNQLQQEMNRLFDRWGTDGNQPSGAAFPAVNVWEDGDAVLLEMELPGLKLDNLEIYVTGGNQISIEGERKPDLPEKAVIHRQERGYGNFTRLLTLPAPVDPEKVEARLENGILTVKLNKHEAAKPRKITVKG